MTAGDVRVLLVWVVTWFLVYRLKRWLIRRRPAPPAAPSPAALASQQRFLERLAAMRAAAALEETVAEGARRFGPSAPDSGGLRLTGSDRRITEQLIHLTRHPEPRRSAS